MLTKKQKHIIFFASLILITGLMAMDLINPSLPYIMHSLNTNEAGTKPLIVFYLLGLGISQFFYGTFSDNYGRKKTILVAGVISMLSILLSIISHSIAMLYLARFINGFGSGGAAVIGRAIITDVCTDSKSIKQGFSYFTTFGVLSPTVAPVFGGFIQQYSHNWRWCFVALLFVTLVSGVVVQLFMPETHAIPAKKTSLLNQSKIYLALFGLKRFMIYGFLSAVIYVFSISYYTYMPFILFSLHFSPVENGLLFDVYGVALIIGALSLAKYFSRFDSRKIFSGCCIGFLSVSLLFYLYFYFWYSISALILLSIITGLICGISAPLTLSLCMDGFGSDKKGAASAVQGFMKMFFTGVALFLFNFIPLHSMASLLLCYIILAIIVTGLFILDRLVIDQEFVY